MKDRRLTAKQIERLLANNPTPLPVEPPSKIEQPPSQVVVSFRDADKNYDTMDTIEQIKNFCAFVKEVITHYEENQRLQDEAEVMEMDLKHAIELAQKLTEKEKKVLYQKLTDVLQTRRACKSENEILQPFYNYFSDKVLVNKLAQLQGTMTTLKEVVCNRTYSCRTSILDDFRNIT